ncbi:hypothetical protein B0H14DRAFT_3440156 [Mycena olivaceomarginata]|nr:hypothetical protein B0H14DRAFT_3440156 [Mycena olivaceomarginata]
MDLQLTLQSLREQADSLKTMFPPVLRRRNARVAVLAQEALPRPVKAKTPQTNPPGHFCASGVQFWLPVTPQSIPRSFSHQSAIAPSPLALPSSTDNDNLFQASELPDISADHHDSELDVMARENGGPRGPRKENGGGGSSGRCIFCGVNDGHNTWRCDAPSGHWCVRIEGTRKWKPRIAGLQVCWNFNTQKGCTSECKFTHACTLCGSGAAPNTAAAHNAQRCPSSR